MFQVYAVEYFWYVYQVYALEDLKSYISLKRPFRCLRPSRRLPHYDVRVGLHYCYVYQVDAMESPIWHVYQVYAVEDPIRDCSAILLCRHC